MPSVDPTAEALSLVRDCASEVSPNGMARWYESYVRMQSPRIAVDVDLAGELLPAHSRILDLGAVPPLLMLALRHEGHSVTGLDIDPDRFGEAIREHGLDIRRCNIEQDPFPFEDASFDAVICNEVLEHLRMNPVHTLREARRVLRPGGTLLLSSPNLRSMDGVWNLLVHGRSFALAHSVYDEYGKLERLGHMGHVREYAPGDVRELLGRVGFEVRQVIYRGRQRKAVAEAFCRVVPQARKFATYVATATEVQRPGPRESASRA